MVQQLWHQQRVKLRVQQEGQLQDQLEQANNKQSKMQRKQPLLQQLLLLPLQPREAKHLRKKFKNPNSNFK